jgi:accessory gene regulator B
MCQLKENHEKRGVYYYGFQVIIGALVKGVLMIAITLILGTLIPTLTAVFVFGSLRMMAGGYHMDTYGKCIAISLAMFIVSGLIVQHTYQSWSMSYIMVVAVISFIAALIVIIKWAPADTPNKPITKPEEIRKFKRMSFTYVFVLLIAMVMLAVYRFNMYALAIFFGLILETFTITPAGYRFFDSISGKVDQINN